MAVLEFVSMVVLELALMVVLKHESVFGIPLKFASEFALK